LWESDLIPYRQYGYGVCKKISCAQNELHQLSFLAVIPIAPAQPMNDQQVAVGIVENVAGCNFEAKETVAAARVSIELPIFDRRCAQGDDVKRTNR
jgi:hypothetical protein